MPRVASLGAAAAVAIITTAASAAVAAPIAAGTAAQHLGVSSSSASGELALPSFWGSSMVLPRDVPLTLWGTDAPGSNVTVAWSGKSFPAIAPARATDGRFEVPLPASNLSVVPQSLVVQSTSGSTITLSDIVVGDVFVCSGCVGCIELNVCSCRCSVKTNADCGCCFVRIVAKATCSCLLKTQQSMRLLRLPRTASVPRYEFFRSTAQQTIPGQRRRKITSQQPFLGHARQTLPLVESPPFATVCNAAALTTTRCNAHTQCVSDLDTVVLPS